MAAVSKRDYYETLGVDRNASDDDLKKAYRKLARQHHPDLHTGDQQKKTAEDKFKEINEAYEVLKDAGRRAEYDELRQYRGQGGSGFEPPPGWRSRKCMAARSSVLLTGSPRNMASRCCSVPHWRASSVSVQVAVPELVWCPANMVAITRPVISFSVR